MLARVTAFALFNVVLNLSLIWLIWYVVIKRRTSSAKKINSAEPEVNGDLSKDLEDIREQIEQLEKQPLFNGEIS